MILNFKEESISSNEILSRASPLMIYEHFLGESITRGTRYNSPFREDKNPSLTFTVMENGAVLWRDWGDFSQEKPQDVFAFVMKLFNCSFYDSLKIINQELGLGLDGEPISINTSKTDFKARTETLRRKRYVPISVHRSFFKSHEIAFWEQFGISIKTLADYDVFPVDYSSVNGFFYKRSSVGNPVFAFKFSSYKNDCYKIYAPYNKHKWITNCPPSIIQGMDQLNLSGDLLIITKSLKDVMLLREFGYDAIAPQSESSMISVELFNQLKKRFDDFILFYDNDAPGKYASEKFSKELGINYILIPDKYGEKDLSDFAKKYGTEKAKKILKQLINEKISCYLSE